MPSVCFYFKVHQPFRIKNYSVFDIGKEENYFDDEKNKIYLDRIVKKSYIPTLNIIYELIKETNYRFKVTFGITGVLIEQLKIWHPEVIDLFKKVASTGCVEFTGETYYHSLSSIYSKKEFIEQVLMHKNLISSLFNQIPRVFSNTELLYFDDIVDILEGLGFDAIITEGVDHILEWRSPNFIYEDPSGKMKILLRNYKLSDDISFRFSSRDWEEWPLTADKFAYWISQYNGNGEVVNLFMDFETFGEHQWSETGIFDFLVNLPFEILKQKDLNFMTLTEAIKTYPTRGTFSSPYPITWADVERDLTAWVGNEMQKDAIQRLYALENRMKDKYLDKWRKLQTADHFYYMCTKWFADGDVHKYFNPYESPYVAYINFRNILEDLNLRL
ncbi:MAG: glycoside hydrolase family 57 protein [Minisyncoccia bacterium]